jgi:type I restriction-modification system DNA methylase subunit
MVNFQNKANFIWQVVDDILRGSFKQHEYSDVILPFVVLRHLDLVLEGKKDKVIKTHKQFKDKLDDMSQRLLKATDGLNFYNTSFMTFGDCLTVVWRGKPTGKKKSEWHPKNPSDEEIRKYLEV